jgi:hypothetical protein
MKIFGYEIRKAMTDSEKVEMLIVTMKTGKCSHKDLRKLKRELTQYDTKKKQWKIKIDKS